MVRAERSIVITRAWDDFRPDDITGCIAQYHCERRFTDRVAESRRYRRRYIDRDAEQPNVIGGAESF